MVNYEKKNLPFKVMQSWLTFIHWYIISLLLISFSILSWLNVIKEIYLIISLIAFILGIVFIILQEIKRRSNYILIDKHKIECSTGIINSHEVSIYYDQITDFSIQKSFICKIFDIGEIHINTSGSIHKEIIFDNIPDPESLRSLIEKLRK